MTHPQTATVVGELMDRMHTSASSRLIMQNRRTKMRGAEGAAHQSMFQMHARCKTGNIPGGNVAAGHMLFLMLISCCVYSLWDVHHALFTGMLVKDKHRMKEKPGAYREHIFSSKNRACHFI
eukprot:scaffold265725_cov14-Tisochrysis_lutea.AAC.1